MSAPVFDSFGHDWEREYNDAGEPVMSMSCRRCGYRWFPFETAAQIGDCPKAVSASVAAPEVIEPEEGTR